MSTAAPLGSLPSAEVVQGPEQWGLSLSHPPRKGAEMAERQRDVLAAVSLLPPCVLS